MLGGSDVNWILDLDSSVVRDMIQTSSPDKTEN